MLSFFPKTLVDIPGFPSEQWSITRVGRSKTTNTINTQFQALVPKNTNATTGTPVTIEGEVHFVTTLEKSFVNTVCQLRKTNALVDIVEVKGHYTGTKKDYDYEELLYSDIPVYYEEITAKMQQYDLGLLAKTTKKFLVSDNIPLKNLHRIKLGDNNAQVDGISASQYPGLLWVQCSNDTRPVKVVP